jgi:virginiamycin B lyase
MAGAWAKLVAVMVALAAAAALWAGSADAALYWPGGLELRGANLGGSSERLAEPSSYPAEMSFPTPPQFPCDGGIAVSGSFAYWAIPQFGAIARADLDTRAEEPTFIGGLEYPCGVAVDAGHLYWAESSADTIGRANLEGGEVEREFVSGVGEPCGVAVGGDDLYWTARPGPHKSEAYVGRMAASGGIVERIYEGGENVRGEDEGVPTCAIAADPSHAYFSDDEGIGRVGPDGSSPESAFIPDTWACGIAVVGPRIYWTAAGANGYPILGADLEGSKQGQPVFAERGEYPCALAADAGELPPPPDRSIGPHPPPRTLPPAPPATVPPVVIRFGGSRHASHQPATFVSVYFGQAGTMFPAAATTAGQALALKVAGGRTKTVQGVESRLLRIGLPKGGVGEELLGRLRRGRKVKIEVTVRFADEHGSIETKGRRLFLAAPVAHPGRG